MTSARNQRRLARKAISKKVREHPATKRLVRAAKLGGAVQTEIYILNDDGSGKKAYFDIAAMKKWAAINLQPLGVAIDLGRVQRLIAEESVTPDHIFDHTIRHEFQPIIVCRDVVGPGEDHIVDGSHRYVAWVMGLKLQNLPDVPVPAYLFLPDQWKKFLIPEYVFEAVFESNS